MKSMFTDGRKRILRRTRVRAGCRPGQAVALFRILQEGLNNAARHALAKSVAVSLKAIGKNLILTICDTGIGFDVQFRSTSPAGLGLIIMRETYARSGRTLESRPGRGTTITASVPREEKR